MLKSNPVVISHMVGPALEAAPGASELLRTSMGGLIYGTPEFLSLLSEFLEAETNWLVATRGDKITALFPFIEKCSGRGSVINSLPFFGSNGGPISAEGESESVQAVSDFFLEMASNRRGLLSSTVVENPLMPLSRSPDGRTAFGYPTDVRISQVTPLDSLATTGDLLARFEDPRPRNIRKAKKLGVKVLQDQSDRGFAFLIDTHRSNMKAIGGLPKESSFFELLRTSLSPDKWRLHVALLDDLPIAALLTLRHNQVIEYFTPVIHDDFRSTQALSYIIFEAMWEGAQEGYTLWNWGGTWLSQPGVYDFKRKWGAKERRYEYFTTIYDEAIRRISSARHQMEFPHFYLYPYRKLGDGHK